MKFLVIILLVIALYGNTTDNYALIRNLSTESAPVDSNIFKYYLLKVGNKWSWYIYQNNSPGPGYKTAQIQQTISAGNHIYYKFKIDTYIFYGNQHYTGYSYKRIDSLNGNLYDYFINDSTECLTDSLNSSPGDSTYYSCGGSGGKWYRYSEDTYNIFNQIYQTKNYGYSNYFEAGDGHIYAKGIGYIKYEYAAHTAVYNETLRGCIINGVLRGDTSILVGINHISSEIPEKFSLSQNFPNPFNPVTKIKFSIPQYETTRRVVSTRLTVYDALGQEAAVLVNQQLQLGTYEAEWDASAYLSGVYFYKLVAETSQRDVFTESRKMVLIK